MTRRHLLASARRGGVAVERIVLDEDGDALVLALARVHIRLAPCATVEIILRSGAGSLAALEGAGFRVIESVSTPGAITWRVRRRRTLPDLVRPGLRLLVCGLNPSLYSADKGIPFARAGNRFWRAAVVARLVVTERDPFEALRRGIGFTDLVKRATAGTHLLRAGEYRNGVARVEALVQRFRPGAVCFVGLDGWRKAVDRDASSGWIAGGFGGRPAYLMPSTSGRNARVLLPDLVTHLRTAVTGRGSA
jgi:double-stranded uracil-DNA glycosylase